METLPVPEVDPFSFRKINVTNTSGCENRSNQKGITAEELVVNVPADGVIRELEHHGLEERHPGQSGFRSLIEKIRNEGVPYCPPVTDDIRDGGVFIRLPAAGAMVPEMRAKDAELRPADVKLVAGPGIHEIGHSVKPGDIMSPEAIAG